MDIPDPPIGPPKPLPGELRGYEPDQGRRRDHPRDPSEAKSHPPHHDGGPPLLPPARRGASNGVRKALVKLLAEKWLEQSSVEAFDFMGNKKQAEARVARIIRRNWGLTCAFSWASHKISALHRLNSRSAGLIQIAEEMEYDQQIDDNPAVLYDQAGSEAEEEC